jgi:hypothetical protein
MCNIFSFWGCSQNKIKNDIYLYGTKEFENKVEKLNVSLEQAVMLASDYYFNNQCPDAVVFDYSFVLHIMYGDNYIFTTVLHNPKRFDYNMTGIWVDGMTGETRYIKTKKWTNLVDLNLLLAGRFTKRVNKIYFNSPEFANFEKLAKIKYNEAVEIHNKYCNEKDISFPHCFPELLYCEEGNYIFGYRTNPIDDKMQRVMILYTLKINSQTGYTEELSGMYKPMSTKN